MTVLRPAVSALVFWEPPQGEGVGTVFCRHRSRTWPLVAASEGEWNLFQRAQTKTTVPILIPDSTARLYLYNGVIYYDSTGLALDYVDLILRGRRKRLEVALAHAKALTSAVPQSRSRHVPGHIRELIYVRDEGQCVYCGATGDLTVDHLVPWSLGGGHDVTNLVTCCSTCNSSRGARFEGWDPR